MNLKTVFAVCAAVALSACAQTTATQVSRNQVIISASAAPACGRAGAARVASQMAAVETLRRGFERYIITGADAQSNVRVTQMPITGATTTAHSGFYNTTFTGGGMMAFGTHDADLAVVMFNRGDRGFNDAVDARSTLGPEWEQLVRDGIRTCR